MVTIMYASSYRERRSQGKEEDLIDLTRKKTAASLGNLGLKLLTRTA